LTKILFKITVN